MKNLKVVIILSSLIIILSGLWFYFSYQNSHYIVTDDAKVDAKIVKVSPQISGRILELPFIENQMVEASDVLGRLSDDALPAGANLDLTIIRAPISGQIIEKLSSPGEMGSASSPVALMVDPSDMYITANIEEDKIKRVQPGQEVHFTLDSFPGVWFEGNVDSIGSTSTSMLSLLPAQNSGSTFIKVTQRIPVKIRFHGHYQQKLLPGMNARVKIYLRQVS